MKHRYVILNQVDSGKIQIQEYAELERGNFTFLCEESFSADAVASASTQGKNALMAALRTDNFYPIDSFAERIAEAVMTLSDPEQKTVELVFDDMDTFKEEEEIPEASPDLDALLEEKDGESEEDDEED